MGVLNYINKIDKGVIKVRPIMRGELAEMLMKQNQVNINKDSIRDFIYSKNKSINQDDIELLNRFMVIPEIIIMNQFQSRNFTIAIETDLKTNGKLDYLKIQKLIKGGLRCYPFSYGDNGMMLGIITSKGHIIIE